MPVLTKEPTLGDLLKYELNGNYNREVVTLKAGTLYPLGAVLGRITTSGLYRLSPAAAVIRGEKLSDVLKAILQDIARIVARRTITEPLINSVSAATSDFSLEGLFGSVGSWLGGLFRAEGGPVARGEPYIVGERGPEWFVPQSSGTVLPSSVPPAGLTIHQTISIDARGADPGVELRLRVLANQIARQSQAMTLDAIRRGGVAWQTVKG